MARGARTGTRRQEPRAELTAALEAVLSTEEVRLATAAAFLALDEAGRQRLLEQLPTETAEALRPVLNGVFGSEPGRLPPPAGRAKIRQDWQRLWSEWAGCIDESSYEEGRYVRQEHDWEPPYLDQSAVTDDLEAIARRMRSLMPRVWAEGLDPERSFIGEVRQAADGIGAGLPNGSKARDRTSGPRSPVAFWNGRRGSQSERAWALSSSPSVSGPWRVRSSRRGSMASRSAPLSRRCRRTSSAPSTGQ